MCKERHRSEQQAATTSLKSTHIWSSVTRFLRWLDVGDDLDDRPTPVNLEDEYQRACRTESYVEFAQRVALAQVNSNEIGSSGSISPVQRSIEFERLAATLLEPEEDKVLAILAMDKELGKKTEIYQLVSQYLEESRKSSTLWTLLLKSIQRSRDRCQRIGCVLNVDTNASDSEILAKLCVIDEENLFSVAVLQQFQPLHDHYLGMQKKLDRIRKKVGKKLRLARACLKASTVIFSVGCFIVLLVTTLAVFLAIAALVLGIKAFSFPIKYMVRRMSRRKKKSVSALERQWRQIEAVTQGTFVLVQDLDTTRRLVMRLGSEVDFMNKTVAFCARHKGDGLILAQSLERLRKNQTVLSQLLDDLEVNIYLSFMSINRARRELCVQ